jgi:hypothetical protein
MTAAHVYCHFINYRTKKSTRRIRRLRHKQPRLPTHIQQNTQKDWNKGGTSSGEHETFPRGRGREKKRKKTEKETTSLLFIALGPYQWAVVEDEHTLLEKRFIRTSGIYFLYRLISVADTINKK